MILINRGVLLIDYFRGLLTNLGLNALFLWLYIVLFVEFVGAFGYCRRLFDFVGKELDALRSFFSVSSPCCR
jgi:hypothetical protein